MNASHRAVASDLSFAVYLKRLEKGELKNPPIDPKYAQQYIPVERRWDSGEPELVNDMDSLRRG